MDFSILESKLDFFFPVVLYHRVALYWLQHTDCPMPMVINVINTKNRVHSSHLPCCEQKISKQSAFAQLK